MLTEDSQCKACQESDCQNKLRKSIYKTRSLSNPFPKVIIYSFQSFTQKELSAGNFSYYRDHAPVI